MNLGYKTTNTAGNTCGCGKSGSVCDTRKVKAVTRVNDQVIIAFDDCTYMAQPFDVVDTKSVCGTEPVKTDEQLAKELQEAKDRVVELEAENSRLQEKLDACPSKCDILKKHLVPVQSIGNAVVYYALRDVDDCEGFSTADESALGGETGGGVVVPAETEGDAGERERENTGMTDQSTPSTPSKPAFECDYNCAFWVTEDGSPTTMEEAVRVLQKAYPTHAFSITEGGILEIAPGNRNRVLRTSQAQLSKVGAVCLYEPWRVIATIAE